MAEEKKYLDYNGLTHYNDKVVNYIDDGDTLNDSITVELGTNGTLGGYKTGDTIDEGTPWKTIVKKLLAKQVPPTYTAPTITLANNSGDAAGAYEYGASVTPKVKATFTKNDAGALSGIIIKQAGTQVASGTSSPLTYTASESIVLTGTVTFTATATYGEGAIKNDNLGDPYSTGHIEGGSKTSSNYSYTVYRPGFYWGILTTSSADEAITSDIIRAGTAKTSGYAAGTIGTEKAPVIKAADVAGRKRIFVACPATNKGVTKVIMPSAMNADCTSDFVKQDTVVNVAGANDTAGINYNVWVYEPAAISDDQTFTVTLG